MRWSTYVQNALVEELRFLFLHNLAKLWKLRRNYSNYSICTVLHLNAEEERLKPSV